MPGYYTAEPFQPTAVCSILPTQLQYGAQAAETWQWDSQNFSYVRELTRIYSYSELQEQNQKLVGKKRDLEEQNQRLQSELKVLCQELATWSVTGEILKMSQYSKGVDQNGKLQLDIMVRGNVPEILETEIVEVSPYWEQYLQTGVDSTESACEATDFFSEEAGTPDLENPDDLELPSCPPEEANKDDATGESQTATSSAQDIPGTVISPPSSLSVVSSLTDSDPPSPAGGKPELPSSSSRNSSAVSSPSPAKGGNGSSLGESPMGVYNMRKDIVRSRSGNKAEFRDIPRLSQTQFIQMWKTLYDMFGGHDNEQELYHAIATVGTLLLEIGEVGKKFYLGREESSISATLGSVDSGSEVGSPLQSPGSEIKEMPSAESTGDSTVEGDMKENIENVEKLQLSTDTSANQQDSSSNVVTSSVGNTDDVISDSEASSLVTDHRERTISSTSSKVDTDWSISFEQFLASMLTEPAIVQFFEKSNDLSEAVDKTRNRRLLMRQMSAPFEKDK